VEADSDPGVVSEPQEPYTLIRVENCGYYWVAYYWTMSGKTGCVDLDWYNLPYRYQPKPHDEVWALKAALYRLGQLKRKARSKDERRKKAEQG
jgi:hypothetical protein